MSIDNTTSAAAGSTTASTEVRVRGGALLDALAAVRPFMSRSRSAQAHECSVMLSFDAQGGSLACETGAVSVRVLVPEIRAEEAGEAMVSHEGLKRAVSAYAGRRGPSSRVELRIGVTDEELTLTDPDGERGTATVRVRGDEYVPKPITVVPGTLVLERAAFAEQTKAVAIAAERPRFDTLPILTAVRIESDTMVATDRYRLANIPLQASGDLKGGAQPEATALAKVMGATTGETVSIGVDKDVLTVHADNMTASLLMQMSDYPKVQAVVRGYEESPRLQVSAGALRDLLAPYVKGCGDSKVTLTTTTEGLAAEVRHGDGQVLATNVVPLQEQSGEPATVLLDIEYLVDALKVAASEQVEMRIKAPLKPVMIGSTVHPDRYCMVQPIKPAGG